MLEANRPSLREPRPRQSGARLRRQALLAASGLGIVALVYLLTPSHPQIARISLGTAYAGLILLAASLMVGPVNVVLGRRSPPSTYLRRDIGVSAGVFAIVHVVAGLQVHLRGDIANYFLQRGPSGDLGAVRADAFGFANHTGLFATILFLLLLSLSNNASLRALKAKRWKSLQRTAYVAALLVLAHGALYQVLEGRPIDIIELLVPITAVAAAVQLAGFLRRRRDTRTEAPPA